MNKIMLIGRVAVPPSSRAGYCKIRLAVTTYFSRDGIKRETTEWFNVTGFRKTADIMAGMCDVGTVVYCEGRMTSNKYTDSKNVSRTSWSVICEKIQVTSGGKDYTQHLDDVPEEAEAHARNNL
mgnify:CR=1 FL=1